MSGRRRRHCHLVTMLYITTCGADRRAALSSPHTLTIAVTSGAPSSVTRCQGNTPGHITSPETSTGRAKHHSFPTSPPGGATGGATPNNLRLWLMSGSVRSQGYTGGGRNAPLAAGHRHLRRHVIPSTADTEDTSTAASRPATKSPPHPGERRPNPSLAADNLR